MPEETNDFGSVRLTAAVVRKLLAEIRAERGETNSPKGTDRDARISA